MKEILSAGVNCYEIGAVNQTGLLIDGRDYYRAFCAASESAEHNNPHSRLRRHPLLSAVAESESWIETIFPDGLPLDPEGPVFGEDSYEQIPAGNDTLFPKGINWLSNFLSRGIE